MTSMPVGSGSDFRCQRTDSNYGGVMEQRGNLFRDISIIRFKILFLYYLWTCNGVGNVRFRPP